MDSLMHFNFDFVIIVVFIFGIAFSFYKGFPKSATRFFHLALSFLIIELINQKLIFSNEFIKFVDFIIKINNGVGKVFKLTDQVYLFSIWLVYILIFIIIGLVINFTLLLFRPSVEKQVTKQPKKLSRISGAFVGVVNAYMVLILIVGLGFNIFPYQNKGLTKLFFQNPIKLTSIEKYSHSRLTIEQEYTDLKEADDFLTNRSLNYEIDRISSINQYLRIIEEDFENNFEILITNSNSRNTILNNLPETDLSVSGYAKSLLTFFGDKPIYEIVLDQESVGLNPHLIRLTNHFNFLRTNEPYINLLFDFNEDLNSDNLNQLLDYILLHGDQLGAEFEKFIVDIKVNQYLNNWIDDNINRTSPDEDYLMLLSQTLTNHQETIKLAQDFNTFFKTSFNNLEVSKVANKYNLLFTEYIKYESIVKNLTPSLSLSTKIMLAKVYGNKTNKDLFHQPLMWGYLNDCLSYNGSLEQDSQFEKTELITEIVITDLIETKPLNEQQIDKMMNNLMQLVNKNVLTLKNAQTIMDNFIQLPDKTSLFDYLVYTDEVTFNAIEKLVLGEYDFITMETQDYLAKKYILN